MTYDAHYVAGFVVWEDTCAGIDSADVVSRMLRRDGLNSGVLTLYNMRLLLLPRLVRRWRCLAYLVLPFRCSTPDADLDPGLPG